MQVVLFISSSLGVLGLGRHLTKRFAVEHALHVPSPGIGDVRSAKLHVRFRCVPPYRSLSLAEKTINAGIFELD